MDKLPRVTGKIFASNAAQDDIGQFGSALTGNKILTGNISEIQALPAYETGWRAAVLSNRNYPTLQEMNGVQKTFSQQIAYILQNGIPEYDSNTTYYKNQFCRVENRLYYSLSDNNIGNNPENDSVNWHLFSSGEISGNTSGYQIFDPVLKDRVLNYDETYGYTLQGDWAYAEAEENVHYGYPDFYTKCLSERNNATETRTVLGSNSIITYNYSNGHIYYDISDKSIVDAYFAETGIAWFFGIDEENGRILMPRNNYFFRLSSSNPGGINNPGAPSITHTHGAGNINITGELTGRFSGGTGAFSVSNRTNFAGHLDAGGYTSATFNSSGNITGSTSDNTNVNAIYGRETNQIMISSSNMLLYIVTGATIPDSSSTIDAKLTVALDRMTTQETSSITEITNAGITAVSNINNTKNEAVEDIQTEGAIQTANATAQADRAEQEAEKAKQYSEIAVQGQVQADWTQSDPTQIDYIKNKPNVVTVEGMQTIINKTINATENDIKNLTTENFQSGTIVQSIDIQNASVLNIPSESAVALELGTLQNQVNELQIVKYPNFSVMGNVTINSGNANGFTSSAYLQFPYIWDFRGYSWILETQFTTSSDVTTQQNIIDSPYGIAVAISGSHFVLSVGANGNSWDIGSDTGTYNIETNTTYTLRIEWNGAEYTLSYSLDETDFTDDVTIASTILNYATQQYVGGSPDLFGTGSATPFGGTINLNKWKLTVNNSIVWLGMDDVGLSSRANVSLNNLDATGEERFNNKVSIDDYASAIKAGIVKIGSGIDVANDGTISVSDLISVTTLPTSGTVTLTDNSVNSIIPSGSVTFILPAVTDNTVFHQILVQVNLSTLHTINVGTTYYFDKTAPDMSSAGMYNLMYEYDKANGYWVCGCLSKGAAA